MDSYSPAMPNSDNSVNTKESGPSDKLIRMVKTGKYITISVIDRQLTPLFTCNVHQVEGAKLARRLASLIEALGDVSDSVEGVALGPAPRPDQLIENMPGDR